MDTATLNDRVRCEPIPRVSSGMTTASRGIGLCIILSATLIPLSPSRAPAQFGWDLVRGEGGKPYILHLSTPSPDAMYAAAFGGTIYTSTDTGRSWIKLYTGTVDAVRGIQFSSPLVGMIVGDSGIFLTTTDRGANWEPPPVNPLVPADRPVGFDFSDGVHGFIPTADGRIRITADGGQAWTVLDLVEPGVSFMCVDASGPTGLIAGTFGRIYLSTDRGQTWAGLPNGYTKDIFDICIVGPTTFLAVGENGSILRSTDGGQAWNSVQSGLSARLTMVTFVNSLTGFIGSSDGTLLRTDDGGSSWSPAGSFGCEISDCRMVSAADGVLTFLGRRPVYTTDGGWSWHESGTDGARLNGVSTFGSEGAVIVGERGLISRTTDAGITWTILTSGTGANLNAVHCYNAVNWMVVGDSGVILRSTDLGNTWTAQPSGTTAALRGVNFTGPLTGWVAGDSGTILRTINGGSGWTAQSAPTTNTLYGVRVIEPVGFVVGDRSILRTTNSGAEWREFNTGSTAVYRAVSSNHFSNVVIAGSFGSGPGADPVPLLRHSTDLGVTWQSASGMFPLGEFFGVSMHRYANIDAVGTGGRVYRSTNGGITWGPAFNPAISTLRAVSYSDSLHGWAAGDEGVVLTTRDGVPMPQPLLLYPTSGEVVQLSGTVQLAWLPPPGVTTRIQLGEDPSFSTMVLLDSTFTSSESRVDAPPLARSSRYFWRVNHTQPNLTNGWSQAAYFYTGGFGVTTVHEIQFVPSGQLISADAVQNTNPAAFWTRQASPVNPLDTVRLTACCAVPPGVLATGAAYSMIVLDPDTSYGRWAGLLVEADSNVGGYIAGIGEGEIISIDGTVLERPQPSMGSMTILKATGIRLLGGGGAVRTVPATVETFYTGAYPGGSIRFSGGEPLEGMIVRMENLVVDSVLDPLAGTFTMTDRTGNSFTMSDASRWFTLGPHRDPLSAYAPPAPGDFIGAIRGVIVTSPDSADTRGYMIAPIYPGDLSILPHAAGVIAGTVFGDANFNGVLDPGEPPLPGWDVHLSGGAQLSAHPDASGKFKFIYLDSGSYSFGVGTKPGWMITHPASGSYNISLGVDDTAADNFIGLNYGGSMVRGILFEDGNRNGVQDSGEGGMPSWTIILDGHRGGTGAWVHRSERTDANGAYRIDSLQWGTYTVTAADSLYWFQSLPESTAGHPVGIGQGVTVLTDRNFGRYRQVKVKIGISVADRAGFNHTVSWGVVPGASFGVWQADPGATLTDTLEGELEIPPRSFARLVGFFDSRFTDPHYPLEFESPRFGQGSWTDVREYEYPVQSDTFLLSFLPSYLGGGGYPMTLRWSRDQMAYSYGGPVVLRGGDGVATDMKTSDSIVVTSTAVEWCSIIATNPNIPPSWIAGWRLVSLPVPVLSGDYRSVFPSARSQAYTFDPGGGYTPRDTMVAGEGYWLKYREAMDPLTFNPSDRLLDTIPVRLGWNLIGALSSPITPGAVIPIPPGLIRGDFFGFDDGYYISTTLLPGRAYWVNVSADGSLILDATLNGKVRTAGTAGERLNGLSRLEFTDAGGRRSGFYLTTDTAFVSGPLGLPPVPPSGCFDARLTPERLVEVISPDVALKTPVKISSAIYPITVRWSITGGMNNLSIVAGEYTIPVSGNGEAEIRDAALPLLLRVDVGTIMPEAFSLRQNYPNPFNPLTTIRYDLPVDSRVTLRVFDMLGREVASLIDGIQTAGFKELRFDATPYPSGIYFLRITAGSYTAVRKMVLIK